MGNTNLFVVIRTTLRWHTDLCFPYCLPIVRRRVITSLVIIHNIVFIIDSLFSSSRNHVWYWIDWQIQIPGSINIIFKWWRGTVTIAALTTPNLSLMTAEVEIPHRCLSILELKIWMVCSVLVVLEFHLSRYSNFKMSFGAGVWYDQSGWNHRLPVAWKQNTAQLTRRGTRSIKACPDYWLESTLEVFNFSSLRVLSWSGSHAELGWKFTTKWLDVGVLESIMLWDKQA